MNMENWILEQIRAHETTLALTALWVFSAIMSTMPPLSEKAGFWTTWIYKFLQAIAANFNKHDNPTGIAGPTAPQAPAAWTRADVVNGPFSADDIIQRDKQAIANEKPVPPIGPTLK